MAQASESSFFGSRNTQAAIRGHILWWLSPPVGLLTSLLFLLFHPLWRNLFTEIAVSGAGLTGMLGVMTFALLNRVRTTRSNALLWADDAVRASEVRYRALYRDMPAMFFTLDATGTVISVNQFGAQQLGFTVGELEGQSVLNVFHEPDRPTVLNQLQACLEHPDEAFRWQFRKVRKDGSVMWVEEIARAVHGPSGDLQVLVVCEDITPRKRAEQELHASQRLLRTVFDSIPFGLTVKDANGRGVMLNRSFLSMMGTRELDYLGRTVDEVTFLPEDYRARIRSADRQVMETAATLELPELPTPTRRGEIIRRVVKVPILDDQGNLEGVVTMSEDITERNKAEKALSHQRQLLQTVFDTVPHHLYLKDLDGRLLMVNRSMAAAFEIPTEHLLGRLAHELVRRGTIPPEDRARVLETDAQVLSSGALVEYELGQNADVGRPWLRVIKAPVRDPSGTITKILCIVEDITDKMRALQELCRSRALLQTLYDTVPYHLFIKDAEGRYLMVNKPLADDLGQSPEALIGSNILPGRTAEENEVRVAQDRQVLEQGIAVDDEVTRHLPGGAVRRYRLIKKPIRTKGGQIYGLVGVAEDVTERRAAQQRKTELEAQLQQAQKMETIGRLAAGVAHDFNNLLTPIMGQSQLMLRDLSPEQPAYAAFKTIEAAAERGADLTRGLLAFGRKQVLQPRTLDMNEEIARMIPFVRRVIGSDIEVLTRLAGTVGPIKADPSQLHQVLMNLVVNAKDAMPSGGTLIVETRDETLDEAYAARNPSIQPGRFVMVSVSDTGLGMSEETLARAFEPFFTTKEPGKGTGLGLATVHGIVKQHGGDIHAFSTPGVGTTFKIYLPQTDESGAAVPVPRTDDAAPRGTERVLVVDDDRLVLDIVAEMLRQQGYDVAAEASAEAGLARATGANAPGFDLLVTDIVMPKMNGFELFGRLSVFIPRLKVLYISGHPQDMVPEPQQDPALLLGKPFPLVTFLRKVREVLDS